MGLERAGSRDPLDPSDPDVGRIEHQARGLGDLRTDAVAGDDRHAMRHAGTIPDPSEG